MTTDKQHNDSSLTTAGHWFGDASCPGFGWVSASANSAHHSGVLILPPFAYEYWTTHHSLQTLQERLADDGHLVLRIDYIGTGDAAGDVLDADCLARWQQEVKDAIEQLRNWGAQQITLIGLRFGALLALQLAQSLGVQQVVAWLPITSGRQYVRELKLMASQAIGGGSAATKPSCKHVAGVALTEAFLAEISSLNLGAAPVGCKVLVIDRQEMPIAVSYAEKLRDQSVDVEYIQLDDAAAMLNFATEEAGIARHSVEIICQKLHEVVETKGERRDIPTVTSAATWLAGGARIMEQHLRLTDLGLSAIETVPMDSRSGVTLVFLNSGSEKHVGPGRAWVEFARTLANRGHVSVRVDFQGWGESPDNGYRPGRPYNLHGVSDTRKIMEALRERGHTCIVPIGVCVGAWIALRACQSLAVQGMVAFNPQLYYAETDPYLPNMRVTRIWYNEECIKESWIARRQAVEQWVRQINALSYPVDIWFEQGDSGVHYLEQELPHVMAELGKSSILSVHMLPGLDHSMHRYWLRHEALEAIDHLIARINMAG